MVAPGVRVIAGSARGRRLVVPKGEIVRPTKDRVKASIFSALAARDLLHDSVVLDLFAGSGALAIEALSRGAASATMVERAPAALDAMRANVAACGFEGGASVIARDVGSFVASCVSTFDIVFVDPPYEMTNAALGVLLEPITALAPAGTIVIERASRSQPGDLSDLPGASDWRESWRRTFGDTLVVFWTQSSS
jgi:16S rRNA (guanine966-N2)-methyltransferase